MDKIAFFVGSDITSNLLVFDVVNLLKERYKPYIYFVRHLSKNGTSIKELQELAFFERTLLNEVIYPFLNNHTHQIEARYTTPEHFCRYNNIILEYVENINDPGFARRLHNENIVGGISIRCYQKFGLNMINYFNQQDKFIWNLHPGLLPQYRGVMTCIRALSNLEVSHTYTLHEIDSRWDAGPVLDIDPVPLKNEYSMLTNMIRLYPSGIKIIERNIDAFFKGTKITGVPQNESEARYYSFPTASDFKNYKDRNMKCVDRIFMQEFYLDMFTKAESSLREKLNDLLDKKILNFYGTL